MTNAKNQLIEGYSFGMKKKIQLIAAILSQSPYVLADEVFNGLDFETLLLALEAVALASQNRSFVLVTHSYEVVNRFSDRIYLLDKGQLQDFSGDLSQHVKRQEEINEKIERLKRYMAVT